MNWRERRIQMAIRAGRVGVRPDQVDVHGRLVATDWLVDKLRELLNTNSAEISANREARLELERLHLDTEIIQKPVITPVEPVLEPEVSLGKDTEQAEETEVVEDGTES